MTTVLVFLEMEQKIRALSF